nr:hypothetical protein [Tanacetum cinerariifolium]
MLEKVMYDSNKIRIMLYIQGKENGEMFIHSIKNGPVKLLPKITVKDIDGFTNICHPYEVADLSQEEKLRYESDIKAANIILLGLPDLLLQAITNFKADHVDAYDSDSDDEASINAIFMENVSRVGSINDDTVEPRYDSDILSEDLLLQAITNFKADHVDAYDSDSDDEASINAIFMENVSRVGSINDDTVEPRYDSDILSEETLILAEESRLKMIEKQSEINAKPIDYSK